MKNILSLFCAISIFACTKEVPKHYVSFSGTITNKNGDTLIIRSMTDRNFSKTIVVNEDGTFKDTLKVETGIYRFSDTNEGASVFLKNGFDLNVTLDTDMFDETIKYTGIGAEHSNFLAEKYLYEEKLLDVDNYTTLELDEIPAALDKAKAELNAFYVSNKAIDTAVTNDAAKSLDQMMEYYNKSIPDRVFLKTKLITGVASPTFEGYENYTGGETSLEDLKGKYVYVDVWATWCGPCKAEIPFLKKVESAYHGKNIEFVSISVDDPKDYDTWRQMIAEKELGGIQLFADNKWESDFVQDYKINGIPRFILIDPEGNIVNANAPRPSDEKLINLLESLDI